MAQAYVGSKSMQAKITVVDQDGDAIDLSAASVSVAMTASDDTRSFNLGWTFFSDGSDGIVLVPLEDRLFTAKRTISLQVRAEFSASDIKYGSVVTISVKESL